MAFETVKAISGVSGVGIPAGYIASYFLQSHFFRLTTTLAEYIIKTAEVLVPSISGNDRPAYANMVAATAWTGIAIGLGVSLSGYLAIRSISARE
jgi:hypothetical protein